MHRWICLVDEPWRYAKHDLITGTTLVPDGDDGLCNLANPKASKSTQTRVSLIALILIGERREGRVKFYRPRGRSRAPARPIPYGDHLDRRLDRQPDIMRVRRQTVDHPIGIIASWMGRLFLYLNATMSFMTGRRASLMPLRSARATSSPAIPNGSCFRGIARRRLDRKCRNSLVRPSGQFRAQAKWFPAAARQRARTRWCIEN